MRNAAATAAYLVALLVGAIGFNADQGQYDAVYLLLFTASFGLGYYTGRPWLFLLPLLAAVPLAIPFGYAEQYVGSDAPPVPMMAGFAAVPSAAFVLLGAGLRRGSDRHSDWARGAGA